MIIFATLETKRELEPKCVPQFAMVSLLGRRWSAIGPQKHSQKSLGNLTPVISLPVSKVENDEQQI